MLDTRMEGASSIIVNVGGSRKLKLREIDDVARTVVAAAGRGANIVFGMSIDRRLRDEVQVTLIATGLGAAGSPERQAARPADDYLDQRPAAPAPASPAEWRPVWLRRADAAKQEATPTPRAARRKRRAKRERQAADATPDVPFLSDG